MQDADVKRNCADLSWKWDLRRESLANACYLDLNHSLDHHRLQHDDVHRFFWAKNV
jgi:hypothetical protein